MQMNGSARKTRSKFCVLHGRLTAQTRGKGFFLSEKTCLGRVLPKIQFKKNPVLIDSHCALIVVC